MKKNITLAIVGLVALTFALGACDEQPQTVTGQDQQNATTQLDRYQRNQPVPQFDWSQYRQTLIDIESAQVHGVGTTSFFFNQGVAKPIKVCPSIGFAMPSTAQLTNPDQQVNDPHGDLSTGSNVLPQAENNGVYTGDSSGTYVVCVTPKGQKYITYWEGFVHVEGGPAHWDNDLGQIVLDGAPTVIANTK